MSYFDENENRIIYRGIPHKPKRIHTPPNVQSKWEKRAAEMRKQIELDAPPTGKGGR